jgi:hypothetical protein
MNIIKKIVLASCAALLLLLTSCEPFNTNNNNNIYGEVWVPVYASTVEVGNISIGAAIPTVTAGKIYLYNNYIIQNEQYKGFHIIDNSNPANPVKVAFLNVPFSTEISIKNNYLYTNSVSDLVVINISNIMAPVVTKRVTNAFPLIDQEYPPLSGGTYFQCVDKSKGTVVRWELKQNLTAKCRR